jgi:hypothetical protein
MRKLVVVSDLQMGWPPGPVRPTKLSQIKAWATQLEAEQRRPLHGVDHAVTVEGGYLHLGILEILSRPSSFTPREAVLKQWTWQHSLQKLHKLIPRKFLHATGCGNRGSNFTKGGTVTWTY